MFIAALFVVVRHGDNEVPWMTEDVVHIYNGTLLSHKKDEVLPFVTV